MVLLSAFLLQSACLAKEVVITFFAQNYTPDIVSGDNQKPLHQFARIAKEWEKLHPGVKIKFIRQPVGDYRTWMITQLKGGMAPDIMWAQGDWCNEDAKYGFFAQLDPYLNKPNRYIPGNKRWLDIFYQGATNTKRASNGTLYALPIDQVETGIFYNKDIFKKAGVKPPKTWAQMMEVCKKLKKAGYIPMQCDAQTEGELGWAKIILADQLWNDKIPLMDVRKQSAGGFPGVDPQEFVRAYKKGIWSVHNPRYKEQLRILKEWAPYWNKDFLATTGDRLFRTGKAAMQWNGGWYMPRIEHDPLRTFDYGVFPIPKLTKETSPYASNIPTRGVGGATSIQYAITNSAMHSGKVELAVDFLEYATAPRNLGPLVAEAEMFVPNCPGVKGSPILAPFTQTLEAGHVLFGGEPAMKMYGDQAYRVLQGYLGGQYTLDQTVDHLDFFLKPDIDQLIKDNPQWNFDKDWNILPDKTKDQIAKEQADPPFVKFIPWSVLGMVVAIISSVIIINRKEMWQQFKKKKGIYPFIIPSMLLLAVFNYYPIFSAFYHSLFDWQGGGQSLWVGLANFKELSHDVILREASVNALKLLGFGILVTLTVPLTAAELIFHLKSQRAQYIYRVLFVIPMVVPGIVMLLIWGFIYDYNQGIITQLMHAMNLDRFIQVWLGDPKFALYALMFMGFPWIGGFSMLIYYAGLQNISQDVLDSCKIDGASGLKRIRHIDVPLIMGQIKLLVVLGFIGGLQGFQTQLILTQGGPGYSTMVPGMHLFQNAISYDRMGYACAIGVVIFVVILGLTYINMKYLKSSTEYEAS